MEQLQKDKESSLKPSNANVSLPSIIHQNRLLEEKKRLRDLYTIEENKLHKKCLFNNKKMEDRQ